MQGTVDGDSASSASDAGKETDATLKRALKGIVAVLVLFFAAVLAWGLIEPYTLDVEQQRAVISGLPPAWEGKRIAVIGDLQIGMWLDNESTVRRAVELIVMEQPALTLIVGDFVYHASDSSGTEIEKAVALVEPLSDAGIPTFAVLGNHDYALSRPSAPPDLDLARALEESLERNGIPVLVNEARAVQAPGGGSPLYVVGLGSRYAGLDFAEEALDGVPASAPRVVMMHHPDSFAKLPASSAPLAVAGHTHGGQLRLPFSPTWSYLTFARQDEVHVDGWIEGDFGAAGNKLYVNRGIGMSLLPLRINAAPEVTFFTLQPPAAAELSDRRTTEREVCPNLYPRYIYFSATY